MAPLDPPTQLTPCYIPARVLLDDQVFDVTLTRLGANRAQLSGELPLEVGERANVELNRPTDGRRIRVEFQVAKVHREGAQWGWKPAFHLDLDERLDRCSPLTEEHVPVYPGRTAPEPPLPTVDPDEAPAQAEPSLPPGSWIGAVFEALESADGERPSLDEDDAPLVPRPLEEPGEDEPPPADDEPPDDEGPPPGPPPPPMPPRGGRKSRRSPRPPPRQRRTRWTARRLPCPPGSWTT